MKGIVFNLLESVVLGAHGLDAWEDILETAGVDGSYTGVGQYPDAELSALLDASATTTGMGRLPFERWFGEQALPVLAELHPSFFRDCPGARRFLLNLDDVIHAEVQKLMPDAYLPAFVCDHVTDDGIVMSYASRRRLCLFGEGLLVGTGTYFDEPLEVTQTHCMHRGAPRCRFEVGFG